MAEVPNRTAALIRQGLLVIDVVIFIVILLFLYNDYLHYALQHRASIVVTTETTSSDSKLPLGNYPGDQDGEVLLTGPSATSSNK